MLGPSWFFNELNPTWGSSVMWIDVLKYFVGFRLAEFLSVGGQWLKFCFGNIFETDSKVLLLTKFITIRSYWHFSNYFRIKWRFIAPFYAFTSPQAFDSAMSREPERQCIYTKCHGLRTPTLTYFASIYVALPLTFCDKDAFNTAVNATSNGQRLMLWFIRRQCRCFRLNSVEWHNG